MSPGYGEAERLRAELRAREVLSHPRVRLAEPLPVPCGQRAAVLDLLTGEILIGYRNDVLHIEVVMRHGLDETALDRFVGGFISVSEEGQVRWSTISGTYPADRAEVPRNFRDLIRGLGIHVFG